MAKGIYKRGNIYWIRYAGLDCKTVFESTGSHRFKDAEALLIKRKNAIKEGKQPEVKRIKNHTFRELSEKYCLWMQGRHKSAESKQYRINTMLSHFGSLPLRRFTTLLLEQYQTDLMNKGLKPASVNRNVSIIKAMISKAVDWQMVESEALKRVRNVKQIPENNRRLRYLTKEECQTLISSCDNHLRPIVITALNTGMRKGEILSLKWDNVNLINDFIHIEDAKNGEKRVIPINVTLKSNLRGITRRLDVPYVFHDPTTGKPYKEVKKSFATAMRRSGITDFRFHDLRHTFASHLVMSGVDITTVSSLLGHKSLKMTLRYSHLAPDHIAKAVDMLDQTLNGRSELYKNYTIESNSRGITSVQNL